MSKSKKEHEIHPLVIFDTSKTLLRVLELLDEAMENPELDHSLILNVAHGWIFETMEILADQALGRTSRKEGVR